MLLQNIEKNRNRVQSILTRLDEAEDEEQIANTLTQLLQEEIVSPEQYEKLMKDDAALELTTIASIMKDTKV